MERYLRTFVKYQQRDWLDKLSIAEFVANNNDFASARLSSFFALRELHLCISFDIVDFSNSTTCEWLNKKKVIDISEAMQSIWKYPQKSLTKA